MKLKRLVQLNFDIFGMIRTRQYMFVRYLYPLSILWFLFAIILCHIIQD